MIHGETAKGRSRNTEDVGFVLLDHEAAERIETDGKVGAKDQQAGGECAAAQPCKTVFWRGGFARKNAELGNTKGISLR